MSIGDVKFMSFLERLYSLMQDKNINKNSLCKTLEINGNSFVNWENRGTLPKGETLIKMAHYFNVTSDYLLGLDNVPNIKKQSPELSEDTQRLIEMYTKLNDMEKGEILGELKALTKDKFITVSTAARSDGEPTTETITQEQREVLNKAKPRNY